MTDTDDREPLNEAKFTVSKVTDFGISLNVQSTFPIWEAIARLESVVKRGDLGRITYVLSSRWCFFSIQS